MNMIEYPDISRWDQLIERPADDAQNIEQRVREVIENVRQRGDEALLAYTEAFDKVRLKTLQVTPQEIEAAYGAADPALIEAMTLAAVNIGKFHAQQNMATPLLETSPGVRCWQKSVPIEKVGIYVPGGSAPLLSSLLMLAIPAKLAGCGTVVACSPPDRNGDIHPSILAAAKIAGIDTLFKVGGAQAIAAMAWGTESVPQMYKIFGPGNRYVTVAKQQVSLSGVAIDLPAGPSEVAVLADAKADPEFLAWDLLSQAEHGPDSQVMLITDSRTLADSVKGALSVALTDLPRKAIAEKALAESRIILVHTMDEGMEFINRYAPEHLIINTADAADRAGQVRNAGSVFIGSYTPESAGDYASGTNHTLPTNACARAYSGITLESFRKIITFQQINETGLRYIGPAIERLAAEEGLEAHRKAVSVRLEKG